MCVNDNSSDVYVSTRSIPSIEQVFEMNLIKEVKWDRDGIRKGHKKCKRREATSIAQRQLPLSGTFKDPLAPLRGKNATDGQNRRNALTAERHFIGLWANFL
ncbi:hypothetical protein LR48_Vigan02g081700 [Vigna angularis]|uniref:Uncharacterized protein n=1 Tax=Phaseolus angularis TaxID=3914 RepID=A0A0L9TW83_PHAAN|nr:hypothetical protein LR48_Vigan02g081700 [Vigna angularis]